MLLRRTQWHFLCGALLILGLTGLTTLMALPKVAAHSPVSQHNLTAPDEATRARISESYGKLPLSFEANQGQTDQQFDFLARGDGYTLLLNAREAMLALNKGSEQSASILRMRVTGANSNARAQGREVISTSNYLVGGADNWRTNIPNYRSVAYRDVYPGIDMVYYGNQRQLEYDFVVAPGADPKAIALKFDGAEQLALDADGNLVITVNGKQVRQLKPVIYQELNGVRSEIAGNYRVAGNQVGFEIGRYDTSRTLVIDPVLTYATYLGGTGFEDILGIAVDAAGNVYVTGSTDSANFRIAGGLQGSLGGGRDAFVTKLNPAGNAVIYSTFLGGNMDDLAFGIAVDASGSAYIVGSTSSPNFPTLNAAQGVYGGGITDVFVAKLNASGSALAYSTFVGGRNEDQGFDIFVDGAGSAYITGFTISVNFPLQNPIQTTVGVFDDAFVTKLSPSGNAFVYSTYLGGNQFDTGLGIAVDAAGSAYVVGRTTSPNFPTANAFQATLRGDQDAFIAKLSPGGNSLVYSTYVGGNTFDAANDVAVDAAGNAYFTGFTLSNDFPTLNAVRPTFGGGTINGDAFVTKVNAAGSGLVYSTFLGGEANDIGLGIAVDRSGSAYVAGTTASVGFPLVDPIRLNCAGCSDTVTRVVRDAFIAKLNPAGNQFTYSTYAGGTGSDVATDVFVDNAGNAYVGGSTTSDNLATSNTLQSTFGGGDRDAFIMKIADVAQPDFSVVITPTTQTIAAGSSATFNVSVTGVNNFNMPVNLAATVQMNANVSASFSQPTVTPGGSSQLTVNVGNNATAGPVQITITGTSGAIVRTATATVNVTAPDFSIALAQPTLTVSRKTTTPVTINITRMGVTGMITVSAPNNGTLTKLKVTPQTIPTTGNTATFNIKTKKGTPLGTQTLVFSATDGAGRVRTATLTLTVQ